jgi:hypothetical protein
VISQRSGIEQYCGDTLRNNYTVIVQRLCSDYAAILQGVPHFCVDFISIAQQLRSDFRAIAQRFRSDKAALRGCCAILIQQLTQRLCRDCAVIAEQLHDPVERANRCYATQGNAMKRCDLKQCKVIQSEATKSDAERCKTMQSDSRRCILKRCNLKRCKAIQGDAKRCKAVQSDAKPYKAKESDAKRC